MAALFAVVIFLGLSGAILAVSLGTKRQRSTALEVNRAFYTADSGVSDAIAGLVAGNEGDVGSEDLPIPFGGGTYWVSVVDNDDETFTLISRGTVAGNRQAIEAVVQGAGGGIFNNAVFAGNSSGDPLYDLDLGGSGGQADVILGDVYSAGDIRVEGDATVTGLIRAHGVVDGASGESNASLQPIPDLAAENYETQADFDVLAMFQSGSSYKSDDAGGSAWQMPESSPGHIFRANPSDRKTEYQSTPKVDFFLEDPYESVNSDGNQDGSNTYQVSLSGVNGEPGVNGNRKVYYIDGNLWLHNKKSYSFAFESDKNGGSQVTFVVKGNIYFSDNMFYDDAKKDGVAFIAMNDDAYEDSGNIYFGDPVYGTLVEMNSYMYAENNFYDNNLDASGSAVVRVNGIMSAGNQVEIDRDYGEEHSRLTVDLDERVATGDLELPGLPSNSVANGDDYMVLSWRLVGASETD